MTEQSTVVDSPTNDLRGRVSRALSTLLLVLIGVLLVEVLFEAWVQNLQGTAVLNPDGTTTITLPDWPKNVKNGLYILLLGLAVVKVAVDRTWRRFTSAADYALAVLGIIMVITGILGGSDTKLIGEALYVYFRGVIVFLAWRAVNPSWLRVRPMVYMLGGILFLNAIMAILQMIVGPDVYKAMGWLNLTWAAIYRAQGFVDHPNHLGHVTALTMLGLLAWFVTLKKIPRKWLWLFGTLAVALSATQSREATIGFFAAAALIGILRKGRWKPIIVAITAVAVLSALQLALRPESRQELQRRLAGVWDAFAVPSGDEGEDACVIGTASDTEDCVNKIPQREIRLLYLQQGLRLFGHSPILGYGIGQFGGIVAEMDDPNWNLDPRFGPHGFDMHGSTQKQVDTFWLHLLVEVGALGFLAYLLWLFLLIRPIVRSIPGRLRDWRGPPPPDGAVHPLAYWAPAALLFAVLVAFLSPALEDPLFPPILFSVLGLAWVLLARGELVRPAPDAPDMSAARAADEDDDPTAAAAA